ncbi:hypothetical protein QUB68_28325 [Microcoleus sp. A006_D1]|uniref:hypothetical protein n=1 Tax=Microcoleus sp. A006_D1 TaxID=3055267 RepID=UPI002FD60EB1
MKITEIGYSHTKTCRVNGDKTVSIKAKLEDWEDPSESLDLLRERVADELDLGDRWRDLRGKVIREKAALHAIENGIEFKQEKLNELERRYNALTEFLKRHGVNPETLAIEYYDEQKRLAHTTRTDLEELTDLYLIASADDDDDEDDASPDWDSDDDEDYDENYNEM